MLSQGTAIIAIRRLHVGGYRSLRDITLDLQPLTVVLGANGTGKSNLYNALRLVSLAARGELARALAAEGGMPSILWAGGERKRTTRARQPVRAVFEVQLEDFGYVLELGLPVPSRTLFQLDPEVKVEAAWAGLRRRPSALLLERTGPSAFLHPWSDDGDAGSESARDGARVAYPFGLLPCESVLAQVREPRRFPELAQVRDVLAHWRFYHHFRTDAAAPARQPQVGVRTPVLADGGDDLGAALQTIVEIGDGDALAAAIDDAFTGAHLQVVTQRGWFEPELHLPGIQRPLGVRELSDGTLRYLCLLAALLSPRPPALLVLNEPETSLHPDLLRPLAARIIAASAHGQVLCTTHSQLLAELLAAAPNAGLAHLRMEEGETRLAGERAWFDEV